MTESGFGAQPWGSGPWGDGAAAFALLSTIPRRENVLRLGFTQPVFLDGLLGPFDGASPSRYAVSAVAGSVGADGDPTRTVSVIRARLAPADDVDVGAFGFVVDLTLDRPMSPYPAAYLVTVTDLFSADLSEEILDESQTTSAVFRELARPRMDEPSPSRDIASPMTASGAAASGVPALGSYLADSTGDYAIDQGQQSLKKRLWRRLVTEPGSFSHLPPDYGVGIRGYAKRLASSVVRSRLATTCEAQFAREPEVAKVKVALVAASARDPGAFILRVYVRTRIGLSQRFDMPVG